MQDTVFMMNGDVVVTRILDTLPENVYCMHPKPTKKKPDRKLLMEKERIFSIKFSNGAERLCYKYDTMAGNFFTVPEMRCFVNGEQDASKYFRGRADFWGGLVVGLASGTFMPRLGGTFWAYLPCFAYTGTTLLPIVKVRAPNHETRSKPHTDIYLLGYERIARKKKITSALKGTVLGLAAGILAFKLIPTAE